METTSEGPAIEAPAWSGRRLYFEHLDLGGNTAIGEVYPDNPRYEVMDPACANLVSSLATGMAPWMHLPVIDIDHPCSLEELSEFGYPPFTWNLNVSRAVDTSHLVALMDALSKCEVAAYYIVASDTAITLIMTVPCKLVPSTTEGHFHLYIDKAIQWREYAGLLKAMSACGIVEDGYYRAALQRAATFVRMPGVKKAPRQVQYTGWED